jgi:hypothetical protein
MENGNIDCRACQWADGDRCALHRLPLDQLSGCSRFRPTVATTGPEAKPRVSWRVVIHDLLALACLSAAIAVNMFVLSAMLDAILAPAPEPERVVVPMPAAFWDKSYMRSHAIPHWDLFSMPAAYWYSPDGRIDIKEMKGE